MLSTWTATLAACVLALASAADPVPPCAAPDGIVPAVPECMCSTVVAAADTRGVSVRSYGAPAAETLVTNEVPGQLPYNETLQDCVGNIILYLQSANSAKKDYLAARTAPITVRPPSPRGEGGNWLVSMMVSTVVFPDPAGVPTPNNFEMHTESMGERLFATLPFITTGLPDEATFDAACAKLAKALPKGYTNVTRGWSPTYVIYSPRDAALWTNECWIEVVPKK